MDFWEAFLTDGEGYVEREPKGWGGKGVLDSNPITKIIYSTGQEKPEVL